MLRKTALIAILCLLGAALWAQPFRAASIFTDNMVLQRESLVPVWGWAKPGSVVTLSASWSKLKQSATANKEGRWEIKLPTPGAGGPYTVILDAGKEGKVILNDVLIGEVWLCSGQSNMGMSVTGYTSQGVEGSYEAIADAPEFADRIRFYDIRAGKAFSPQEELECVWEKTDGAVTAKVSAIAYFFAKRLTKSLGVPVGIIANPWGGSLLPPWMSLDYMEKNVKGNIPDESYRRILERSDVDAPGWSAPSQVATMYNARMYPVKGYAIRGFLWYQGCSELIHGDIPYYDKLQAAMVRCWRDMWGDADNSLPFYYALIAPYCYDNPEGLQRGYFVENQLSSLDIIPNSGVAVTETLGDKGCIHPAKKQAVADQFAMLALERDYGVKTGIGSDFAHPDWVSFPANSSVEQRKLRLAAYDVDIRKGEKADGRIIVHFVNARDGLGHYSNYGFEVKGFEVAGPDKIFHPVTARTDGHSVILDCSSIEDPVAVRYAFHNWCEATLTSSLGLPVASFRTDDWTM